MVAGSATQHTFTVKDWDMSNTGRAIRAGIKSRRDAREHVRVRFREHR